MDQGREWGIRVARGIGERVAFYRGQRKLSAQELAARCEALGMPSISRIVITKLENGHRESVSTAELQVIAGALEVAPMLLLFPLGYAETVEITPGGFVKPQDAIEWFRGRAATLFEDHEYAVTGWDEARGRAIAVRDFAAADFDALGQHGRELRLAEVNAALSRVESAARTVQAVRRRMRELGMTVLPPLPEGLQDDDDQEAAGGQHRETG